MIRILIACTLLLGFSTGCWHYHHHDRDCDDRGWRYHDYGRWHDDHCYGRHW